ncbi:hypothetical protein [Massilimicrobiota timonensis]|uniref:hypothetical protein n=1 Tax=Massilimicrobiota timonensis TaxID=1776392 RepID=UPI00101CF83F|nr:hypothetical protein [Massilimicrobiota timonensis]
MNHNEKKAIINEIKNDIQKEKEKIYNEIEEIKKERNFNKINMFLTVVSLAVSAWIGFQANNIATTSNEISSRQEPIITNYLESNEEVIYNINHDNVLYETVAKKPKIELIQGSLTELYGVICYDKKIQSVNEVDKEQKDNMKDADLVIVNWGMKDAFQMENNKTYDYAFVYLKDGNGNSYINLVYVQIEYKNGEFICSSPQKIDEIELLQYNSGYQYENTTFKEMIEDYQYVLDVFKTVRNK